VKELISIIYIINNHDVAREFLLRALKVQGGRVVHDEDLLFEKGVASASSIKSLKAVYTSILRAFLESSSLDD
jgi:hypothetical protein